MKIPTKELSYEQVLALPRAPKLTPKKPNVLFRSLMRILGKNDLKQVHFSFTTQRMEGLEKTPCLILMNHSSFIDLEMVAHIFKKQPYCIVCTSDGFVGKPWLMRQLGCIPTQKFVTDVSLITNIRYCLNELHCSVLMYPEASYSFDGCATPLPRHLGVLLKKLAVPVVHVQTYGAFTRDPLYNCLQKRQVDVSAHVRCLFTPAEIAEKSVQELDEALDEAFTFDNFAWQQKNCVVIDEPFRADGLNRILYKCPHCGTEGKMLGKRTTLTCRHCGVFYELDFYGNLYAQNAASKFTHVPDWYNWERQQVADELNSGVYQMDIPVKIGMMVDYKAIYMVGDGRLTHSAAGFTLTGCDGALHYQQSPKSSYGLYADYFWYELGDMICIGNKEQLFYCFPQNCGDVVAKARLATEELYKRLRHRKNEKQGEKSEE